jgi:4-hydroxyphenylacetate 3-monooxygenase reductase component
MVSRQHYRDGMARFAAAVHIVTTGGPAGHFGFTASAVCSVTDDPPTLLVCLNRASEMHLAFQENGAFCVNTLAADQRELAAMFAKHTGTPLEERFALPIWETLKTGAPSLRRALACFDCRISDVKEVGTHWVFFGEVMEIHLPRCNSALLYLHRSYRALELAGTK